MNKKDGEWFISFGAVSLLAIGIIVAIGYSMAKASEYKLGEDIIECTEYWGDYYGVCPELLQAVICKESSGNYTAQSGDCVGLMQVNYKYHPAPAGENIWSTDTNIHVGTEYLATLISEGKGIVWALDKYNGQDADANKAAGTTSKYASWIIEKTQQFLEEHGKEPLTIEALGAPKYFVDTCEASTPNSTEEDIDMSNINELIEEITDLCANLNTATMADVENAPSFSVMISFGNADVHVMANDDEPGIEEIAESLGISWVETKREYISEDEEYPYERYFVYKGVRFHEIRRAE